MPQVKCPRCANIITQVPGQKTVCNKCGYPGQAKAGAAAGAAPAGKAQFTANAPTGGPLPHSSKNVPGRIRQVSIGKTIGFSILTFGIYFIVQVYKETADLHKAPGGMGAWQALFWIGIFIAPVMIVLYVLNCIQANKLGDQRGVKVGYVPLILTFIPLVNIVAPFLWAGKMNDLARTS